MTRHLTHAGLPADLTRWQLLRLVESARRPLGSARRRGLPAPCHRAHHGRRLRQGANLRLLGFGHRNRGLAGHGTPTDHPDRSRADRAGADPQIQHQSQPPQRSSASRRDPARIRHQPCPADRARTGNPGAGAEGHAGADRGQALRKQINKLFERIRGLGCDAAELAADAVLPNHRPSTIQSFQRLKQVAAALEAVLADFSANVGGGEMSHQCDISTYPIPILIRSIKPVGLRTGLRGGRSAPRLRRSGCWHRSVSGNISRSTLLASGAAVP